MMDSCLVLSLLSFQLEGKRFYFGKVHLESYFFERLDIDVLLKVIHIPTMFRSAEFI